MLLPAAMLRPWALADSAHAEVAEAYARLDLNALAQSGAPVREDSRAVIADGVAIIPVTGPLFGGESMMDQMVAMMTGGSIYSEIAADFDAAMASEAHAVVLHFKRSPGGDADGCGALSDRIYEARGDRPIIAVVEGGCQSASYWIGSACDEMIVAPSGFVGSIGVKGGITDASGADEKAGVKNIEIVADQSPDKRSTPVTDEVIARYQMHSTELAALFLEAVARNRGTTVEDVQGNFGKGDSVIASKALAAGMIDGIGTLDDVLLEYSDSPASAPPMNSPAPNGARQTGDPKMAIQRSKPLRASAEPEKPEGKKAEADKPEMKECAECGGSGKNADGAKCKHCDGSGEVEVKAESESDDKKAEHKEPDGDEEKHEGKKALAALSGLRLSASVEAHTAAIEAKMVPRSQLAALEKSVADLRAERAAEKAASEDEQLQALAASAEERGYFAGLDDKAAQAKREKFIRIARKDRESADAILDTLPAAKVEGRRTANGNPLGGKHSATAKINAFSDDIGGRRVAHAGGIETIERGSPDLMQKALAHATANKCSIEEAMGAVVKADPSLMQ